MKAPDENKDKDFPKKATGEWIATAGKSAPMHHSLVTWCSMETS